MGRLKMKKEEFERQFKDALKYGKGVVAVSGDGFTFYADAFTITLIISENIYFVSLHRKNIFLGVVDLKKIKEVEYENILIKPTELKCGSCGAVIRKSELEVRGSQKLCTDCAVVHDIDGENVEE